MGTFKEVLVQWGFEKVHKRVIKKIKANDLFKMNVIIEFNGNNKSAAIVK